MIFLKSVFQTYHFEDRILYSQTSPQQPLWGPKKVAVVKKWSLWGGGGVIWQFLLGENNMYIMPSLCLLYAIMEIQSWVIISAPYGSNCLTIPDLFVSRWKNWPLWREFFGSWGRSAVAVAVVERFKLEPMYRLSAGPKKVVIVERWLLFDWFDCMYLSFLVPIFFHRWLSTRR